MFECSENTEVIDGQCVATDLPEPTVSDLLDQLPPCSAPTGDGVLDLRHRCADEVCLGMSKAEVIAVVTSKGWTGTGCGDGDGGCEFDNGVTVVFAGSTARDPSTFMSAKTPFLGATQAGAGLGRPFECFVSDLGAPDTASFAHDAGKSWRVDSVEWHLPHADILVDDMNAFGPETDDVPDGSAGLLRMWAR